MGRGADRKKKQFSSHRDLVKSVSKNLKYYLEIRRQEDGFDLSGPDCPRPHYPALKSRPTLLYEGLHDKPVKHYFSDFHVKQQITHMKAWDLKTEKEKRVKKQLQANMDKVSFLPTPLLDFVDDPKYINMKNPWAGSGHYSGEVKYAPNSDKYVRNKFVEWKLKEKSSKIRGYGNPPPVLKSAFSGRRRILRCAPPGFIGNREVKRLVNGASKILASSEFTEGDNSVTGSRSESRADFSLPHRPRSASPTADYRDSASRNDSSRLTHRTQSAKNTLARKSHSISYRQAEENVLRNHEERETANNLKKGKVYYDIDGRRHGVPHNVKDERNYMQREDNTEKLDQAREDEKDMPDWLKKQMRCQVVDERKMPYNRSVRSATAEGSTTTAKSEDVSRRPGVQKRPKSAKASRSRDASVSNSHVTLSDGSYEEVPLDDSESDGEDYAYYEERGCQTGWELFVQYDQSDNILRPHDGKSVSYKIRVRTGTIMGASTHAPIYVVLYGSRGRSQEIDLINCENHKIPFQQGSEDCFTITTTYVGQLKKLMIGHDSTDVGDGWFLDSVAVEDPDQGEVYEFIYRQWLSSRSEDKLTKRTMGYSASRKIQSISNAEDNEEDDEEAIKSVRESNSKAANNLYPSSPRSSDLSTSHLHADSRVSDKHSRSDRSSLDLPSETNSVASSPRRSNRRKEQDPFVKQNERKRERRTSSNLEEFESDIPLYSDKGGQSSRSTTTVTDSECRTAVFEGSIISQDVKEGDNSFMDGFKAGQHAAQELQKEKKQRNEKDADTSSADILRGPTIHQAAKSGDLARVKELLDHNDDLKNSVNERGNSALHLVCLQGHTDLVKLFCARGANLELRNQTGYEPIHMASLHGHVNCIMTLVAMGAQINSRSDDSKTALHLAAMNGNMETCKWLVANRSDLEAEDDFGRTAEQLAEHCNHGDIAALLRTCSMELKKNGDRRSSLAILRSNNEESDADTVAWKDDHAERPITHHETVDSGEEDSTADLRKEIREREELEAKRKAYKVVQNKLNNSEMTMLDLVRAEVENG